MGFASKESGVLKLVHPGGDVEIHRQPITAAEVMERNPRHFVTRPDVFRFPWLVVRPESVLKLGRVFFIVPYYTIHRLLHPSPKVTSPTSNRRKNLDPIDFPAELADFHRLFEKVNLGISGSSKEVKTEFKNSPTNCFESKSQETSPPKCLEVERGVPDDHQIPSFLNSSEEIGELRSCLKKKKASIAKSRGFRVRFALDNENNTKRF